MSTRDLLKWQNPTFRICSGSAIIWYLENLLKWNPRFDVHEEVKTKPTFGVFEELKKPRFDVCKGLRIPGFDVYDDIKNRMFDACESQKTLI